jgi:hypothetical protein
MKYSKVKDNINYSKSISDGVIINNNATEYHNARIRAGLLKANASRLINMENDIQELRTIIKGLTNA